MEVRRIAFAPSNCTSTDVITVTNMPPKDSFLPFALTTVGICVPTYVLILIVNNPEASRKLVANVGLLFTGLISLFTPKKSKKVKERLLIYKAPHHPNQ